MSKEQTDLCFSNLFSIRFRAILKRRELVIISIYLEGKSGAQNRIAGIWSCVSGLAHPHIVWDTGSAGGTKCWVHRHRALNTLVYSDLIIWAWLTGFWEKRLLSANKLPSQFYKILKQGVPDLAHFFTFWRIVGCAILPPSYLHVSIVLYTPPSIDHWPFVLCQPEQYLLPLTDSMCIASQNTGPGAVIWALLVSMVS